MSKRAVHIRIMADAEAVGGIAEEVGRALEKDGAYEVVEVSAAYPCRAPQDDQARVYVTLLKREGK